MPGPKGCSESRKAKEARAKKFAEKAELKSKGNVRIVSKPKFKGGTLPDFIPRIIDESVFPVKVKSKNNTFVKSDKVIEDVADFIETAARKPPTNNSILSTIPKVLFLHDILAELTRQRQVEDPTIDFDKMLSSTLKQFCGVGRKVSTHLYLEELVGKINERFLDDVSQSRSPELIQISVGRDDDISSWVVQSVDVSAMRVTPIIIFTMPIAKHDTTSGMVFRDRVEELEAEFPEYPLPDKPDF